MGKTTGMFGGMLHVVRKLPGKSILGYFAIYPRINGQVSKDTLPSKLYGFFRLAGYKRQKTGHLKKRVAYA